MKKKKFTPLSQEKIFLLVSKRLQAIEKMSFLEQYAMFMGKAQIVELAIKGILEQRYGYSEESLEKCTLGGAIKKLEKEGLRKDFIRLLWELNEYRIQMAHEFLAIHATMMKMAGKKAGGLSWKSLQHALFKVEEVVQVYDFLNKHKIL